MRAMNFEAKKLLAEELHCNWVGPMPVEQFLEEFLSVDPNVLAHMPDHPNDYFDALPHPEKETNTYQPFIDLVTKAQIIPTLKLLNTSIHADKEGEDVIQNKPDIIAYDLNADISTTKPLSYSQAEVIFEFKPEHSTVDPFDDLTEKGTASDLQKFLFKPFAEGRQACRSQLACYARMWVALQHRTHCFIVYFEDPWARIVRFDRAGAIVTERFNIRTHSGPLLQFLWRISQANAQVRGKDATVSVVTDPNEIALAQLHLNKHEWQSDTAHCILKLQIPDGGLAENPHMREVLVWHPLADPWCVIGRATRGYPGWDLRDKKLVFVKDSWRVIDAELSKEIDILKTLNKADVCNVPKFLYGDDLPGQTTSTQKFAGEDWNKGRKPETFSEHAHIRFASDRIGTPLTKFKSSRQMLEAWLSALIAHEQAYNKCSILHRDISLSNILIDADGNGGGVLNDWDLGRTVDDIEAGPRQPSRFGTWQFMSINSLRKPQKKYTLQDDLESFFWVLLYVVLRYLVTSLAGSDTSTMKMVMRSIFDLAVKNEFSQTVGGGSKLLFIMYRDIIGKDFTVTGNIPLNGLVLDILDILKKYHLVWFGLEAGVEEIADRMQVTPETAKQIYLQHKAKAINNLNAHGSIIALARKALEKPWPTNEEVRDRCKDSPPTRYNKRHNPDDGRGATSRGDEYKKKRSKTD